MDEALPFLLPVVIDATTDAGAFVPEKFRDVQWTRLPGGETNAAFCTRVKTLLGGEAVTVRADVAGARLDRAQLASDPQGRGQAAPLPQKPSRPWLGPTLIGGAAAIAVAIWQLWRGGAPLHSAGQAPTVAASAIPATGTVAEIARVRARIIPDRWQKGDFEAVSATLDRLIQTDPENSDAWALRSISHSLQGLRIIDPGTKPLEAGKAAAERALRYAPASPLAHLALGMHLTAMISRGGDPEACRAPIARAIAALPPDALTRYADLVSSWLGYDFDRTEARGKAWIEAEPGASFPAWILTSYSVTRRRPAEVEKWSKLSLADPDLSGARTLCNLTDLHFYLRANLPDARAAIERVPIHLRTLPRVVIWRWLLAMAE